LVNAPNGHKVTIMNHGKLKIAPKLVFDYVLLIPHFKLHLLSIKIFGE